MRRSVLLRLERVMKGFPEMDRRPAGPRPRGAAWDDIRLKVRQRWSGASAPRPRAAGARQGRRIAGRAPGKKMFPVNEIGLGAGVGLDAHEGAVRQPGELGAIGDLSPVGADALGRAAPDPSPAPGPVRATLASAPTAPRSALRPDAGTRSRGGGRRRARSPRRGRTARCSGWAASSPGGADP